VLRALVSFTSASFFAARAAAAACRACNESALRARARSAPSTIRCVYEGGNWNNSPEPPPFKRARE